MFVVLYVNFYANNLTQGSIVPLVIKWANTKKERQAYRAQKSQSHGSDVLSNVSEHPSLFGALVDYFDDVEFEY